jgi:hypothetical protein
LRLEAAESKKAFMGGRKESQTVAMALKDGAQLRREYFPTFRRV